MVQCTGRVAKDVYHRRPSSGLIAFILCRVTCPVFLHPLPLAFLSSIPPLLLPTPYPLPLCCTASLWRGQCRATPVPHVPRNGNWKALQRCILTTIVTASVQHSTLLILTICQHWHLPLPLPLPFPPPLLPPLALLLTLPMILLLTPTLLLHLPLMRSCAELSWWVGWPFRSIAPKTRRKRL